MTPRAREPHPARVDVFLEIGRRLDAKGWVAANDGNLSVREPDGTFLVTASGAHKGYLRRDQILRVDSQGRPIAGEGRPSSELGLHLTIYRERADVHAVVHAHPPMSTAFAVAREPLDACVLPELVLTLGRIPIAPYATPGTEELGASVIEAIRSYDAVLLANHGAVTAGPDLESAYFTMERVEHGARILFYAQLLGRVTSLDRGEVERLMATGPERIHRTLPCVPAEGIVSVGMPARSEWHRASGPLAPSQTSGTSVTTSDELVQLIRTVLAERGRLGADEADDRASPER